MSSPLLEILDLSVAVEDKVILNGINLTIRPGELHVLMGPNGTGKSTLVSAVMGDPRYGLKGPYPAGGAGILRGSSRCPGPGRIISIRFQAPEEIPVTLENFLRTARGAVDGKPPKIFKFRKELLEQMAALDMDPSYAERYLNVGFSGGERKRRKSCNF